MIKISAVNSFDGAADWNLAGPDWSGRLRLVAKGQRCALKLEDKNNGELFGQCPIDQYPGPAIEAVSDSSRYFVIKIQDENGSRSAFIGIGFSDRSDSFDLNVALQDHFKWLKKSDEPQDLQPKLDLGFKDGQTIKINMNIAKKEGTSDSPSRARTKPVGTGFLPPPPSVGSRIQSSTKAIRTSPDESSLFDVGVDNGVSQGSSDWGDFTGITTSSTR
ncbi:hypothetical protein QYM36_008321 [Artemia franciscana]|uniref:NECAP PHear domain-containing protein n=1 Tax=Artemia franciscana TaxID=6661 RepID=A0AA88IWK4_ARTSF|nr:hypothetical protein QYM36_008321 [Artemia franciscana]